MNKDIFNVKEGIMEDNRKGTWEDVTNYCGTRSSVDGSTFYVCYPGKGYVRALLSKHGISGHCVEGGVAGDSPNAKGYRLARPTADTWAIEHFIPDPEPVIAYKAVRVDEDGVMRSIMCGSDVTWGPTGGHQLDYEIGQNVDGGKYGIFCFTTLEGARSAYAMINPLPRSSRPLAILRVEAYGEPVDTSALSGLSTRDDLISYPSVKVLSVAWEEEPPKPKEEWIDITAECHLTFKEHESGHYIRIGYDGDLEDEPLGYVGEKVEMIYPHKYRITAHPRKVDRGGFDSGCIKVEKRND